MRIKSLTLALAVAAFAVPNAGAYHAHGEHATASARSASTWTASSLEIDRLGPKYVPLQHSQSAAPVDANRPGPTAARTAIANARYDATPVSVVNVVRPSGFGWANAGIGAGVASLTLALVAVVAMLFTRRSRKTSVPERRELAST